MLALYLFGLIVLALGVFGLLAVRGAVVRLHRDAVVRAERVIRTIRIKANEYDRLDSVLSGEIISLINEYDSTKLKETK